MATQFFILFFLGLLTCPTSYALLEEDEQEGRELRWWLVPINIFGTALPCVGLHHALST